MQHVSNAECLLAKAENNNDLRAISQISKTLENAPKLLQLLYSNILENTVTWDELTLKKRKGEYDNIVNRYKSIQQQVDFIRSQPKLTP